MAGSPDGIAESVYNPDEEPVLLEVKCPYRRQIKGGYIPNYYYPQVQLNLFICDLSIADFIEFCPKTNKLNIVRIAKDMDWINNNVPILIKFWQDVEHYREIGIDKHSEYLKKKMREQQREEKKKQKMLEATNKNKLEDSDDGEHSNKIFKKCIIID